VVQSPNRRDGDRSTPSVLSDSQHSRPFRSSPNAAALRRYAFLDALLPHCDRPWPLRRAVPTLGFRDPR
jgi:hypothetical protein